MADRFPFMRVYKEMAEALPKEDRADFYDALIEYALDDKEPEPSTGAAVFQAARRMVDKWKQTSAAGKARAEKSKTAGRSLDGRWTVAGSEKPAKEEKKKRIKDKKNKEKDISLSRYIEKEQQPKAAAGSPKPQDVIDLYNDICIDMPRARVMTEARRKHIQARLKENKPEEIREVFERAEASDFLSGRVEGKDFRADFDWIVGNPQHWQRIIEGVYDNRSGRKKKDAVDTLQAALNVSDEERAEAIRLG